MAFNLKGRSLLTLKEYSPEEIRFLLDLSIQVKRERRSGNVHQRFLGKTIALLFEKRSTRTRCAFETAFGEEGGHPVFLSSADIQLGAKESVEDTARVLGRMFDAIQFRGFKQETVETLARYAGVPVYNGLTDLYHPTQVLADLMTLEEACGRLKGVKMVFAGRRAQQRGPHPAGGLRQDGRGFHDRGPRLPAPGGGNREAVPGVGQGQRQPPGDHRRYREGCARGGCHLHGRVGLHGRGGQVPGAPRRSCAPTRSTRT